MISPWEDVRTGGGRYTCVMFVDALLVRNAVNPLKRAFAADAKRNPKIAAVKARF